MSSLILHEWLYYRCTPLHAGQYWGVLVYWRVVVTWGGIGRALWDWGTAILSEIQWVEVLQCVKEYCCWLWTLVTSGSVGKMPVAHCCPDQSFSWYQNCFWWDLMQHNCHHIWLQNSRHWVPNQSLGDEAVWYVFEMWKGSVWMETTFCSISSDPTDVCSVPDPFIHPSTFYFARDFATFLDQFWFDIYIWDKRHWRNPVEVFGNLSQLIKRFKMRFTLLVHEHVNTVIPYLT